MDQEGKEEEKKKEESKNILEKLIKLDKKHSNFDLVDPYIKYIYFCLALDIHTPKFPGWAGGKSSRSINSIAAFRISLFAGFDS